MEVEFSRYEGVLRNEEVQKKGRRFFGQFRMKRHPDRNSILDEAMYCGGMKKYQGLDLIKQAREYIDSGINNRLWHCAVIVRESAEQTRKFNECWWDQMTVSLQDQISAPYAEHISGTYITPLPKLLTVPPLIEFDLEHRKWEYS